MGNKKVQDYLIAIGMTLGLTAGAVAGGKMLVDIDQLSTARQAKDKIKSAVVSTETFRDMKADAESAVGLVYDLGLIDAKEQAKLGKKINSEDFAYNNRGKLVDGATATAWENATVAENREMAEMCGSAIAAGGSLAIAGFLAISKAHRKQSEIDDPVSRPVIAEDPTL